MPRNMHGKTRPNRFNTLLKLPITDLLNLPVALAESIHTQHYILGSLSCRHLYTAVEVKRNRKNRIYNRRHLHGFG